MENDEQKKLLDEYQRMCGFLVEALAFYADPESYHAILVYPDRPAGAFADDFSEDHGHKFYERPMPGKHAREVLKRMSEEYGHLIIEVSDEEE